MPQPEIRRTADVLAARARERSRVADGIFIRFLGTTK
jgi:hypothetical protein